MSLTRILIPSLMIASATVARAEGSDLRQLPIKVGEPASIQLTGVALTGTCADPTVVRLSFGTNATSIRATGLRSGTTRCTFSDDANRRTAIELVVSEPDRDTP